VLCKWLKARLHGGQARRNPLFASLHPVIPRRASLGTATPGRNKIKGCVWLLQARPQCRRALGLDQRFLTFSLPRLPLSNCLCFNWLDNNVSNWLDNNVL